MYTYKFGGKGGATQSLVESDNKVVVRTKNARLLKDAVFTQEGKRVLENFETDTEFPESDVTVLKPKTDYKGKGVELRDEGRQVLKNEEELRFAGRVLIDPNTTKPVIYTENLFIKFHDNVKQEICEKILKENNLVIKQKQNYATNAYFVSAPDDTGLKIFDIANAMLTKAEVELCHPELIRKRAAKNINPAQWHLIPAVINGAEVNAGVNADKAHLISRGENITIAIIDDGVDIDHTEFNMPGKVVHSKDASLNTNDPRPKRSGERHGTACAGVATASGIGASGVAPQAKLLPIRLSSELGSIQEANAFKWAVDHGADIISCSWGPADGDWSDPADPVHTNMVALPDSTRLAMENAVKNGRGGKGCIITFAAGNGNEDTKFDGYASSDNVIAVAASNDTNKRSVYSDFGDAVWCAFPSSDFGFAPFNHAEALTPGIFTTDRMGAAGYNTAGDYTDDFGGTSSACPGVAGVAALILSVNPGLTRLQVKDILRECCEKVDAINGQYDAQGHSKFYGYGKVDAEKAVKKAQSLLAPPLAVTRNVKIISALVDPAGVDTANEKISFLNTTAGIVDMSSWYIEVKGKKENLSIILSGGEAATITLAGNKAKLANNGATINLVDGHGKVIDSVTYKKNQVKKGAAIEF
ncbi:MAG: S8 family serine peptidase [Ferruginibacter sp.]